MVMYIGAVVGAIVVVVGVPGMAIFLKSYSNFIRMGKNPLHEKALVAGNTNYSKVVPVPNVGAGSLQTI